MACVVLLDCRAVLAQTCGMDFSDTVTAVLVGNLLTGMFVYGAVIYTKRENNGDFSRFGWLLMAFPLALAIIGAVSIEGLPPYLDAISAQAGQPGE